VLAGGRDSRDAGGHLLPYRPNEVLAQRLGLSIVDFPGDHVGYLSHPQEFAAALTDALTIKAS